MADKTSTGERLNVRITAGDAEMVVSWADTALRDFCPDNMILRESVARFRKAFNEAARERLAAPHGEANDE